MIKNLNDLVKVKIEGKDITKEILDTLDRYNKSDECEIEIVLEYGTIEENTIHYDSDFEEFIDYLGCEVNLKENKELILKDKNTIISIPSIEVENRFIEDCTETLMYFNDLQVVA